MKIYNKLLIAVLFCLSLTSCFKWGSRAFDKYPKETALDKTYTYEGKVIIIGAGASGLAAAKILEGNKIDYQIIEATDRYGGRLKKNSDLADFPIDMGAEWIHNLPQILNRLKGKKGDIVDEELVPYHLDDSYSWDGEKYKKNSKSRHDAMFKFMPEYKFKNATWYDFIDENFAKEVKHRIKFNSPVTEINYVGDKVQVKTTNEEIFTADKVLVTVSIGVLKSNHINFVPAMKEERKKAIESIKFLPGFKLMMKFSENFYPDVIDCKAETGEKVYYDIAFKKEAQNHILGLLSVGNSAEAYYQLGSDERIISSVLEELDQIFDGKASEVYTGEYALENWGQHEFTLGTWVEGFQSKESTIQTLSQSLDKKVYFAGEIYELKSQSTVRRSSDLSDSRLILIPER